MVMPANSGVSQRTGNAWMSQEYVLAYYWFPNQTNPSYIVMRVFGEDRIKQFAIQQGEDLTIQFDIDAHEYNGRWFNEIRAYNVIRGGQQPVVGQPVAAPSAATSPFPPAQEPAGEGSSDDLPF